MANILEFLRTVLTDHDAQRAFQSDPAGYLRASTFSDLTGEDVVEAIAVLRGSLPEHVAGGLEPFESRIGLPLIGPYGAESELDAAIRVLGFAVDRVPAPAPPPPPPPVAEYAPPAEHQPAFLAAEEHAYQPAADPGGEPTPAPWPEQTDELAHHQAADGDLATDTDSERGTPAAGVPASLGELTFDLASLPSVLAFADTLETAAADARRRHDDAVQQFTDAAAQHAREIADRLAEVLPRLQQEVDELRRAAEASVAQLRDDAAADREAAFTLVEKARQEAEAILAAARAEADAGRQEIASRRADLRDAEEQLRERLSGIDSLFRKVLDDEGDQIGP